MICNFCTSYQLINICLFPNLLKLLFYNGAVSYFTKHTCLISAMSYNQPKIYPCASCNTNAITVANNDTVGNEPFGIFVNANDTVYVVSRNLKQIVVWSEGNETPSQIISNNFNNPLSIFVTTSDDIYVSDSTFIYRIDNSTLNTTNHVTFMNTTGECISMFIDFTNTLYCSMDWKHKVVKLLLDYESNIEEIIAGNGTNGSTSDLLWHPNGIFVDTKLNLYVADSENNRIQLFQPAHINGETVAGNKVLSINGLNFPTAIVLDADGHLFIADRDNHRIIRSVPNGFQCIVGCSGQSGSASHQLHKPRALWFDSFGNIFVLDKMNHRIQKFLLLTNSPGMFDFLAFLYVFKLIEKVKICLKH